MEQKLTTACCHWVYIIDLSLTAKTIPSPTTNDCQRLTAPGQSPKSTPTMLANIATCTQQHCSMHTRHIAICTLAYDPARSHRDTTLQPAHSCRDSNIEWSIPVSMAKTRPSAYVKNAFSSAPETTHQITSQAAATRAAPGRTGACSSSPDTSRASASSAPP